jgi:multiple sugar transport system substrate-binding protein
LPFEQMAPANVTMAGCTINGTVYCLRNDLAQNLFWYNSALMKQFGYSVPTTWQQWQALGEQVAAHHPGYLVGSAGDTWTDDLYLWPSRCPANDVVGPNTIEINLSSPNCTRAAALVDPLIKDGSVTLESVFSSTFDKTYTDKILALVGPSWYGADLFPGLVPKGDLAAADPLSWAGQKPATGEVGGGLWFMSSHAKDPAAAAAMLTWLSTSWASQGISVGYPAYVADQTKWVAGQQASGFYSDQIGPVFATAATEIWPAWSPVPWSTDSIWASTVSPALTSGSTMVSQLAAYGQQLTDFAQSDGYTVVTKS